MPMKPDSVYIAHFSATCTTRRIVRESAALTGLPSADEYDLTAELPDTEIPSGGLLVVGVPVYAGRVPEMAVPRLRRLRGNETPAIAVAVYGNRDYDDALLELTDILRECGFKVVSAGAFIARHSIFPQVASGRPDGEDMAAVRAFTSESMKLIGDLDGFAATGDIEVKGNRPYRQPASIPLKPKGNSKCNECGTCVRLCPTGAIPAASPRKTEAERCISCGRCTVVCPRRARRFGGLLYKLAGGKFAKANSLRREPDTFYLPR